MGEGGDQYVTDGNGAIYAIMRKGEAMGSFFGYKTDGFFQSEAEFMVIEDVSFIQCLNETLVFFNSFLHLYFFNISFSSFSCFSYQNFFGSVVRSGTYQVLESW